MGDRKKTRITRSAGRVKRKQENRRRLAIERFLPYSREFLVTLVSVITPPLEIG